MDKEMVMPNTLGSLLAEAPVTKVPDGWKPDIRWTARKAWTWPPSRDMEYMVQIYIDDENDITQRRAAELMLTRSAWAMECLIDAGREDDLVRAMWPNGRPSSSMEE